MSEYVERLAYVEGAKCPKCSKGKVEFLQGVSGNASSVVIHCLSCHFRQVTKMSLEELLG